MAQVVFLRGANVGGHRTFRPKDVAVALAHLDVVSLGAAGTFVVRKAITPAAVRAAFRRCLPFAPDLMMCGGRALTDLVALDPFEGEVGTKDARPYFTILAKRPRKTPSLPLHYPDKRWWQVQIVAAPGSFVLSHWRRQGDRLVYPNEVVEKTWGVAATTRNWDTVLAINQVLQRG